MSLTWEVFCGGFVQTNAWLLRVGECHLLIDAPDDAADWLRDQGIKLDALLLTHQHFDHVMDAARIAEEHQCPVYAWTAPSPRLWLNELFSQATGWRLEVPSYRVSHELQHSAPWPRLHVAGLEFQIFHIPGHAPDSVCYYHEPSGACFCGDTIFAQGVGRTDLPSGNFDQLAEGIRRHLYTLPEATLLLPGHGPHTTVGTEKASNPFVRCS